MSEAEQQITDILLPSAKIFVFSTDSETLESAAAMKDDWRFGRVEITAEKGDVETAIAAFQKNGSPDLFILQTDNIDDQFTARLGELSGYCNEDTAAIIVGPVNDVYLYRQLIEMGVSDYLVRPIKPDILSGVISKTLVDRLGVSDSRLVAFVGAKGGVGTSSLAQICAWSATETMGKKTMLMDAAGGWSTLCVGSGFDPVTTLLEISRIVFDKNKDALDRMFFEPSEKLTILAGGGDAMLDPSISADKYEEILNNFMAKSPVVFVDLSGAESSIKKMVLARASDIIAITTPTVTSLRLCRSLLKEISDIRGGEDAPISLVVNQSGMSKINEVDNADLVEALEIEISATISHQPNVFLKFESDIKDIITDKKEGRDIISTILPLLQNIIGSNDKGEEIEADKNLGIIGSFLNKITSK